MAHTDGSHASIAFKACAIQEQAHAVGVSIEFWEPIEEQSTQVDQTRVTWQATIGQAPVEQNQLITALDVKGLHVSTISDLSPTCIAILRGPDHIYEMANQAYYDLIGREHIIGKSVRETLPEFVEQGLITVLDTVYQTGKPFIGTQRSIRLRRVPDAAPDERILNFVYYPLYEAQAHIAGILVHVVDVTDTMRSQEHYGTLEAHYRRMIATSPNSICMIDSQGIFTEVNPAGERMLGRPKSDLLGYYFQKVVAPQDWELALNTFAQVITGAVDNIELELHIVYPLGQQRLIHAVVIAIYEHDQITGMYAVARDITDEHARDERMQLLTMVLEQIEHGVVLMDKDLGFRFINPAAAKMLGISSDTAEMYHLDQFVPDEAARRELATIFSHLNQTGQWSGRLRRRRLNDGRVIVVTIVKGTVVGANGERLYFDLFQDASKALEHERQLRRAERLASLGTLIGGVAHELNNPLTTIMSMCDLLLLERRSTQEHDDLAIIRHEAHRMARIVANLRLSARHTQDQEQMKGPIDLNTVVRHVLKLRAYTLQTGNITVQQDLDDDLPAIYGDVGQLEQVLLNLIVNAEQAMHTVNGAHQLVLRTRKTSLGASVQVIDNGPGIESNNLERLFDPFFTTKAPGEGTGLGLSLVHSLVQEHGGMIQVESTPKQGTIFCVDLRAAEQPMGILPIEDAPALPVSLRVLLVDDEEPIRAVLIRFLQQRGHQAEGVGDGRAALRLLDEREFDWILSDLRMPGMGGEQLLEELQQRGLAHRLIVITGDASSGATAHVIRAANVQVLLKPIALVDIARIIENRSKTGQAGR